MSKNIDVLLKEIIHEQINSIVPPPKDEVWEQLKITLEKERRKIS